MWNSSEFNVNTAMLYKYPIFNCLKPLESYMVTQGFTISNELCVTLGSKHLLRTAQILVSESIFYYQNVLVM